jgi:capsular polysaccharide biosynthesis protein
MSINKNIWNLKLIFNVLLKNNNIVIATVKHYFISLCIIFFQIKQKYQEKKFKLQKNKDKNKRNGIDKQSVK